MNKSNTFGLFRQLPSIGGGFSSILGDWSTGRRYRISPTNEEADYKAIRADWKAIGNDLKKSIETYGKSRRKEHRKK